MDYCSSQQVAGAKARRSGSISSKRSKRLPVGAPLLLAQPGGRVQLSGREEYGQDHSIVLIANV